VMGEPEEKRLASSGGGFDDVEGFLGQAVGEVFTRFSEAESWYEPSFGCGGVGGAEGMEIGGRRAPMGGSDGEVESMGFGKVGGIAEMPFADGGGEIAGELESSGEGDFGEG